jgi:fluoride exporter
VGRTGRWPWISVALGGRRIVGERYHGDFPLRTFLINVSGAFVIGYLSVLLGIDWHNRYGTALKAGVLTGILGGHTTFSTLQLDFAAMAGRKHGILAAPYLLLSVAVCTLGGGSASHLQVRIAEEALTNFVIPVFGSRQNHHRCQTWSPSVRFYPLVGVTICHSSRIFLSDRSIRRSHQNTRQ